jgi:hypothetical protein
LVRGARVGGVATEKIDEAETQFSRLVERGETMMKRCLDLGDRFEIPPVLA